MTSPRSLALLIPFLAAIASPSSAGPGTVPTGFTDQLVVGALPSPVGMTQFTDGRMLFVEQKTARIRLIVNGALAATDPVCTVPDVRIAGGEQGLLGIAIDPQWPTRPYVYVHYDYSLTSNIHIARFTVTGDLGFTGNGSLSIHPSSRHLILTDIPDNADNHNGGTLRFGPDGMLYVSLGEDANPCAAQDTVSMRGVILRLDIANLPAGSGGPPAKSVITPANNPFVTHPDLEARLVWAFGLRNPYRFSIDYNGELFIGDVGQNAFEEISRAAGSGVNLGWPLFEANATFTTCPGVSSAGMVGPIYNYAHGAGSQAVVGGPVYRYPTCSSPFDAFPQEYFGDYFFSEYYTGFLRRLKGSGTSWAIAPMVPGQTTVNWGTGFGQVSDWAVGCDGALWYCRQSVNFQNNTGEIRRIVFNDTSDVPPGTPWAQFAVPYPSPGQGDVTLAFVLATSTRVSLGIYDARGRLVRELVSPQERPADTYRERWDGLDNRGNPAPAGIYFARLDSGGQPIVHRFVRF